MLDVCAPTSASKRVHVLLSVSDVPIGKHPYLEPTCCATVQIEKSNIERVMGNAPIDVFSMVINTWLQFQPGLFRSIRKERVGK